MWLEGYIKQHKKVTNKWMAKGDLQRQYSSGCAVAGQAQSSTVIESSTKPLIYLYVYLSWLLVEHSVIVWNSYFGKIFENNRTLSQILLLIFWCICACVSEIRVFQSFVFVQLELYFMPLALYAQPSFCLHLLTAVYVF